jgi:hypothetical protein
MNETARAWRSEWSRVAVILTCCAVLAGCASRRQASEPPPPITKVAIVPVLPTYDPALSSTLNTGNAVATKTIRVPVPVSGPVLPVAGAGVVFGLVMHSIEQSRERKRSDLAAAIRSIPFDPAVRLQALLNERLADSNLDVTVLEAADALPPQAREEWDYTALAGRFDAVLDVRVSDYGYYDIGRSRGYSPILQVSAHLVRAQSSEEAASMDYYADWADAKGNADVFTTPSQMQRGSLDDIRAQGEQARDGFEQVLVRMADKLVLDLRAHVQPKMPPKTMQEAQAEAPLPAAQAPAKEAAR